MPAASDLEPYARPGLPKAAIADGRRVEMTSVKAASRYVYKHGGSCCRCRGFGGRGCNPRGGNAAEDIVVVVVAAISLMPAVRA